MKTLQNPFLFIIACCTVFLLESCEASQEPAASTEMAADASASGPSAANESATVKTPSSLLIREAKVKFQVKDLASSTNNIEAAVRQINGVVSATSQSSQDDEESTDFVIRVRPEQFQPLMDQLQKESIKLDFRNLTSENVALEYVDVEARIKAKKAVEARYVALLNQAKTLKDIFEVEQQIQAIREEIESAEARMRYLKDQTAFSTIHLTIYQVVPMSFSERIGLGTRFYNAFGTGWQLFLSLIVGLCYLWPLLLMAGGFWALRRKGLV